MKHTTGLFLVVVLTTFYVSMAATAVAAPLPTPAEPVVPESDAQPELQANVSNINEPRTIVAEAGDRVYIVERGDTLSELLDERGALGRLAEYAEKNDLADPNYIQIGWDLILPALVETSSTVSASHLPTLSIPLADELMNTATSSAPIQEEVVNTAGELAKVEDEVLKRLEAQRTALNTEILLWKRWAIFLGVLVVVLTLFFSLWIHQERRRRVVTGRELLETESRLDTHRKGGFREAKIHFSTKFFTYEDSLFIRVDSKGRYWCPNSSRFVNKRNVAEHLWKCHNCREELGAPESLRKTEAA